MKRLFDHSSFELGADQAANEAGENEPGDILKGQHIVRRQKQH